MRECVKHFRIFPVRESQSIISFTDEALGFFLFCRFEMNAHKPFSLCGYSFQNELGFQRDGNSFGSGFPIGARASCWLGNPMEGSALKWQEESNETGGFVAHDFARKV